MKSEKILAAIDFNTESCRYHRSFVSYRVGNLLICDHRQELINSFESGISVFKELLNKPAMVQAVKDKNGFRINLYDLEEIEYGEPEYVLKVIVSDHYFEDIYKENSLWSFGQEITITCKSYYVSVCLNAIEKNILI